MNLHGVPISRLRLAAVAADDLLETILRADDPLRKIEQQLIAALTDDWEGRFPDALAEAIRVIESGKLDELLTGGDVKRILAAVEPVLLEGWQDSIIHPVTHAVDGGYKLGREKTLKPLRVTPDYDLTDEHAQGVLTDDTMYWVGNAWDNQLGGQVADIIQQTCIERGLSRRDAGAELERMFGETFPERSRNYWNVVASAGVVRARTFGNVASFEQAGVTTYTLRNPADGRTSKICIHLNGRTFRVKSAVKQRDAFLAAETPDDAKAAHPWPDPDEAVKLDTDQLEEAGVLQPPFHGECRTVLLIGGFDG